MSAGAPRTAVLGAGAWGTALAVHVARLGRPVALWCRSEEQAELLRASRRNERYLPGVELPGAVAVGSSLSVLEEAELVLSAVPSGATADVVARAAPHVRPRVLWVSATKGLEPVTLRRMSEVARAGLPPATRVGALSGPSFAAEVCEGQPTAVVIAFEDLADAREAQAALSGPTFRAYASRDLVGVEMAGALKNVIAVAAGACTGLGLGHDPLAALVTRGLHEMSLLAVALGADPRTLYGLAGLGDLVLTCTGGPSRNRRLGVLVAEGLTLDAALARLGHVAEGADTTARALELARAHGIEMPIAAAVSDVLTGRLPVSEAIRGLMTRSLKDEAP